MKEKEAPMIQNNSCFLYHVEKPEDKLFLSFENGNFTCYNKLFNKVMNTQGILIPPSFAEAFNGVRKVYPTNKGLFEKAFKEVYFPLHLPKNEYYWKNESVLTAEKVDKTDHP